MKDKCSAVFFCDTHILSLVRFHIETIISKIHMAISWSNVCDKYNLGILRVAQAPMRTHTKWEPWGRPRDPFSSKKIMSETCKGISSPHLYKHLLLQLIYIFQELNHANTGIKTLGKYFPVSSVKTDAHLIRLCTGRVCQHGEGLLARGRSVSTGWVCQHKEGSVSTRRVCQREEGLSA